MIHNEKNIYEHNHLMSGYYLHCIDKKYSKKIKLFDELEDFQDNLIDELDYIKNINENKLNFGIDMKNFNKDEFDKVKKCNIWLCLTQSHTIDFKNGSYYVSDISKIIDDEIKNNFNDISEKEKYIQIVVDVNRYAILVVIKENWVLELDKNFMDLFGFEKNIFEEGYHRSTKIPNLDKTKFLKIYCNLVDNKEDNEFLTNVFIKNNIGEQIIYENHNNYKRKKY